MNKIPFLNHIWHLRPVGLVALISLWVREVPGSTLGQAQLSLLLGNLPEINRPVGQTSLAFCFPFLVPHKPLTYHWILFFQGELPLLLFFFLLRVPNLEHYLNSFRRKGCGYSSCFSFVLRRSHVWCRSRRFDCILLVFFRQNQTTVPNPPTSYY